MKPFDEMIQDARTSVAQMTTIERKLFGRADEDMSLMIRLRTVALALQCGLQAQHWPAVAEAYVQLESILASLPKEGLDRSRIAFLRFREQISRGRQEVITTLNSMDIDAACDYMDEVARARMSAEEDRKSESYECDRNCGETFLLPDIWHCPICDHHWPDHRDECWNCHKYWRINTKVVEVGGLDDVGEVGA